MLLRDHRWADALRKNLVAREKQRMLRLHVEWDRAERERQVAAAKVTSAIVDKFPPENSTRNEWQKLVDEYYTRRTDLANAIGMHKAHEEVEYLSTQVERVAELIARHRKIFANAKYIPSPNDPLA